MDKLNHFLRKQVSVGSNFEVVHYETASTHKQKCSKELCTVSVNPDHHKQGVHQQQLVKISHTINYSFTCGFHGAVVLKQMSMNFPKNLAYPSVIDWVAPLHNANFCDIPVHFEGK